MVLGSKLRRVGFARARPPGFIASGNPPVCDDRHEAFCWSSALPAPS